MLMQPVDWVLEKFAQRKDGLSAVAAILGAISIAGSACLYATNQWTASHVKIVGSIVESSPSKISIAVANQGGIAVAIQAITITADGGQIFNPLNLPDEDRIVEGGKTVLIRSLPTPLNSTVMKPDGTRNYVAPHAFTNADPSMAFQTPEFTNGSSGTPCVAHIDYVVPGAKNQRAEVNFQCYAASLIEPDTRPPKAS